MIPLVLATQVRRGIEDFLGTTFLITNPAFAGCLENLICSEDSPFRGPYLSIMLPFLFSMRATLT
jgi:DEAD/DEAH box helicase domain-containing protein